MLHIQFFVVYLHLHITNVTFFIDMDLVYNVNLQATLRALPLYDSFFVPAAMYSGGSVRTAATLAGKRLGRSFSVVAKKDGFIVIRNV